MYQDKNNFGDLGKRIKEIEGEIDKIIEVYHSSPNSVEKNEAEESLSFLNKVITNLRDKIGDTLMSAGRNIHTKTNEELVLEDFVNDIDVKLTENDFDAVAVIDYMASRKIAPKANSLTEAEANLILLENFEGKKNISKLILIEKANIALLLNKNLNNPKFVENFTKRDNIIFNENSLIKILEKYQNYKKIEKNNLKLIYDLCSVSIDNITMVKKYEQEIKRLVLNKEYPTSISHHNKDIKEKLKYLNARKNLSANEAFIQIGEKWLELELPDPKDKLKSQLNAKIAQGFVENIDNEEKEIDIKVKSTSSMKIK